MKVLKRLHKCEIYAKASKCEFVKTLVELLGQQINKYGMTPTKAKLKVVHDLTTPKDVKEVRSFLGFTNYYRRFIKDFVATANPLADLTHKEMAW